MASLKCIAKLSVILMLPEFHSNSAEVSRMREKVRYTNLHKA